MVGLLNEMDHLKKIPKGENGEEDDDHCPPEHSGSPGISKMPIGGGAGDNAREERDEDKQPKHLAGGQIVMRTQEGQLQWDEIK